MAARVPSCGDCGRRWSQRDARFCGVCGVALRLPADTRAPQRKRPLARHLVAIGLGAVAVAAAGMLVELDLPSDISGVRVDLHEPPLGVSPLSPEEEAALRAASDPDRLACEPRGCELWRITRPRDGLVPLGGGIVAVDDEVVLLLGDRTTAPASDDGNEGDDAADRQPRPARTVVAVDTVTGQPTWQRAIATSDDAEEAGRGWAQLVPGPHGALLLADGVVTSLDLDAEVVWRWRPEPLSGLPHNVWGAVEIDGALVAVGEVPGQPGDRSFVAALDPETGVARWTASAREVSLLEDRGVVVLGTDGLLRDLDVATGDVRWTHEVGDGEGLLRRAGPWIAHRLSSGGHELLDPDSGEVVGLLDGYLVSVEGGDDGHLVAIVADRATDVAADRAGGGVGGAGTTTRGVGGDSALLGVVALEPSGETAWRILLGEINPWWNCCDVQIGPEAVMVASARYRRHFDVATGELLSAEVRDSEADASTRMRAEWYPTPREDLVVAWHHDGNGLDLRIGMEVVTVRGSGGIGLESFDPIVVSDREQLVGIQLPPQP